MLSPVEARILAVLVEKQAVTPDVYPLTVNALAAGCNQKTSRDPVMSLSEAEIQEALDGLRRRTLVIETYGASGRVLRYAQNLGAVLGVPAPAVALLAVLMLRGAQTAAELRAACERLYRFADVSSVEGFLEELSQRSAGALVVRLPKQPGSREHRWAHLLCGAPAVSVHAPAEAGANASLREQVEELRAEVAALRSELAELKAQLGAA